MSRSFSLQAVLGLTLALALGCGGPEAPAPEAEPRTLSRPLQFNGHDYLFIRSLRTWAQAEALCESLGYGLVTINDAQEQTFLNGFAGTPTWWIGLNDIANEGFWRWRHGTSSYTNWYPGDPNSYNGVDEDCGLYNYANARSWVDAPCGVSAYFICESLE